jgi:hypothetical protein
MLVSKVLDLKLMAVPNAPFKLLPISFLMQTNKITILWSRVLSTDPCIQIPNGALHQRKMSGAFRQTCVVEKRESVFEETSVDFWMPRQKVGTNPSSEVLTSLHHQHGIHHHHPPHRVRHHGHGDGQARSESQQVNPISTSAISPTRC